MTEEEQKKTPIVHTETDVSMKLPNGKVLNFTVQDIIPYSLFAHAKSNPDMNWYTNFSIRTNDGNLILPDSDLSKEIETGSIDAHIEILQWDSKSVFQHAQQFARIIFTLTKYGDCTDDEESLTSWIIRSFGKSTSGKSLSKDADSNGILPINFIKSDQPRLIKYFDLDAEQVLIEDERYFYQFSAITHEKQNLIIKSCAKGFFVNGEDENKCYNSLYELFVAHSQYFADNSSFVSVRWNLLHLLEKQPFEPLDRSTYYVVSKKSKLKKLGLFSRPIEQIRGPLREFLQLETFPENFLLAINEGENFYLRMIFEGIKKIYNGEIAPAVEGHQIFIYNDVVISDIDEFAPFYASTSEARKEISGFAKTSFNIQSIDNSVEIDRPIVIDYLGQRYVIIYHADENCVFGYGPEHDTFQRDDRYKDFVEKLKEQFHISDISKTSRGFITNDGKPLLTQIGVLTPRDYNYPDPEKHGGYRIRPEIIRNFEVHKELVAHHDELVALGGLPEEDYNNSSLTDLEKLKILSETRADIIYKAPHLTYDINALTINDEREDSSVPENLIEIAKYINDVAIPKFVQKFTSSTPYSFDGRKLSSELHKNGVNIRYLGKLIPLIGKSTPTLDATTKIIECEMIVRSIKQIARLNKWDLDHILKIIQTIITQSDGFDQLFEEICTVSMEKFGAKPTRPTTQLSPYLRRSLLLVFGIVLILDENGELPPLEKTNVFQVNPHIKFQYSQNVELNSRVQLATNLYQSENIKNAYKFFQSSAQIGEKILCQFNEMLMACHYYLGLIHFQQRQIDPAFQSILRSLIIEERYVDETNPDIIFKLSILGKLAVNAKNPRLAFAFFSRASKVTQMIFPFHPWSIQTTSDAAEAVASVDGNVAINYAQTAIECCKKVNGTPKMLGNVYKMAAVVAYESDKLNLGLKFADEAAKYDKNNDLDKIRAKIIQKQNKQGSRRKP